MTYNVFLNPTQSINQWVGQRKHKYSHIRQVAPMCRHGAAHWYSLANMIELSAAAMRP